MKYGDELDRVPAAELSRRQFLSSGGRRAARIAAGVLLPGAKRSTDASDSPSRSRMSDAARPNACSTASRESASCCVAASVSPFCPLTAFKVTM